MPTRRYTSYRPKNTFPPDTAEQAATNSQLQRAVVSATKGAASTASNNQTRKRITHLNKKIAQDQIEHDDLTEKAYDSFDHAIDNDGVIVNDDAQNAALVDAKHALNRLATMKNNITYYANNNFIDKDSADILNERISDTEDIEHQIREKMKEAEVEEDEEVNIGKHYYANGKQEDLTRVNDLANRLYNRDSNQLNPNVIAALAGRFM